MKAKYSLRLHLFPHWNNTARPIQKPCKRRGFNSRKNQIKPTDRPFQNNFRPFAQLGSTNPRPNGKWILVSPNGIAKSPFLPPSRDDDAAAAAAAFDDGEEVANVLP